MSNDSSPIIEVRDVSFRYEGNDDAPPALDHVNLTIARGDFIAFAGQNGAGKTTLAKTFNGILKPTEGQVIVDGHDTQTTSLDKLASFVGYCYQNPDHQIFSTTVRDEVAFGPRNLGLSPQEISEASERALELVGMLQDADKYPFLLGRGERQKLAVASIIAMDSPVLVVDEPTTGLDLKGSLSIMDLLRQWNADGRTIIIITHDMNIIAEYAKRTIVMAQGHILIDGPTREALTDPVSLAKAFLKPTQITRLAQSLDGRYGFPQDIITVKEFKSALERRLNNSSGG
jgi:energy-coupling factor transport system ATP-binding protein